MASLKLQGRDRREQEIADSSIPWHGLCGSVCHSVVKITEKTVEKVQVVGIPKSIYSFVLFLFFITASFGFVNSQRVCAVAVFCELPGFAYSSVCKEKPFGRKSPEIGLLFLLPG